jgi:hypothetical protein
LRNRGERVSVFYTSNVEQYLFPLSFSRFAETVASLPHDDRSVMIRSYFQGGHPQAVPGYHAAQLMQYTDRFVELWAGRQLTWYGALVQLEIIPPQE